MLMYLQSNSGHVPGPTILSLPSKGIWAFALREKLQAPIHSSIICVQRQNAEAADLSGIKSLVRKSTPSNAVRKFVLQSSVRQRHIYHLLRPSGAALDAVNPPPRPPPRPRPPQARPPPPPPP